MTDFLHPNNPFLQRVIDVIEENIANELFGVAELADQMNMSRSNLLRKIKKLTNKSVSVLIREVRLHHAKQLLQDESVTVSEVSFQVGFSSTSYFTKCFRETFGYTPGEERNQKEESLITQTVQDRNQSVLHRPITWRILAVVIVAVLIVYYMQHRGQSSDVRQQLDRSIAVLPFKNDSNDSSNVYIINGMMEAILDNLQKVEDLKVTSRTTVEKYRSVIKSIPELSQELGVNYFVEGSGQKIGDKILLSVQLIEASSDQHIWSKRYERETKDIFKLQAEVSKNIAREIQAVITPEEERHIEKVPTENLKAYDYYLKGLEYANQETTPGLYDAIKNFKSAIAEDASFAHPYAYMAICYYYLDIYKKDKQYSLEINSFADKALQLDSTLAVSLIAKALYYLQDENYPDAVSYFEKALTIYPNSGRIHNYLSDIYVSYIPNPQKYLKHALAGIKTAVAGQDSLLASYSYLHLSNALAQSGFLKEAEVYVRKSLENEPNNLFSQYLYAYIKLANNFDLKRVKKELETIYKKDTTRLDVLQEVAKICYTMGDYQEAWKYYDRFVKTKEALNLQIYNSEDVKIGYVLEQLGRGEEARKYYKQYHDFAVSDQSIYKDLSIAADYAAHGNVEQGIKYLKKFSEQKDFMYWIVLFLDEDPIINNLSGHPDYEKTMKKIKDNFWEQHRKTRKMLDQEGVM